MWGALRVRRRPGSGPCCAPSACQRDKITRSLAKIRVVVLNAGQPIIWPNLCLPDEHAPTLQQIAADRDWWLHSAGAHYRDLAVLLRETAGKCRLPIPQKELLNLYPAICDQSRSPGTESPAMMQRDLTEKETPALSTVLISPHDGSSFISLVLRLDKRARRGAWQAGCPLPFARPGRSHFEGGAIVTTYRVTLRDRETQTIVGYYNGTWTTDGGRALTLRERKAAEAHAARMRDRCPRNADLIKVEELAAAD
jgi:hypothetical protein